MNKITFFLTAVLLLASDALMACPNCAGGTQNGKPANDAYFYLCVFVFILATYIPFYLLFRVAYKHGGRGGVGARKGRP